MVSKQAIEENWFKRTDVFEIIHYLSQYEESGIEPGKIREFRGKGSEEEVVDTLDALAEVGVVDKEGEKYLLDFGIFSRVAQNRWVEPLSETQRNFVESFCRKYVDDRDHGTIRNMITDSMVHGILEQSEGMDEEILELAREMSLDKEGYDRPGIYADLAMKELSK